MSYQKKIQESAIHNWQLAIEYWALICIEAVIKAASMPNNGQGAMANGQCSGFFQKTFGHSLRPSTPNIKEPTMRTRKSKLSIFGIAAGLLAGMWAINFAPGAVAHEGHKHSHAPASAKKLKNPLTASAETINAGKQLFNKHCASCHGENGKAKTEIAAVMKTKPTDLTGQAMRGITDGEIYWVVTNGIKQSGMPAFKAKASDQERWRMTLYVKHLMGEHPHAEHGGGHAED